MPDDVLLTTCFDASTVLSSICDQQATEEPEVLLGPLWDAAVFEQHEQ